MIRSFFFLAWMVITVIPYALVLIVISIFARGEPPYRVARAWLSLVVTAGKVIGGIKYRVTGMELLPSAESMQPVILCPKHQSTWETFALPALMSHPLAYVFKRELLWIPFFGWCLARLDMVHIDRSKRAEALAKVNAQGRELMSRGVWLIMFPEGTRTQRGSQGRYKAGATRLAVATGASVVPIAVNSGRCWPAKTFKVTPGTIDVSIGKPIPSQGREPDELMREVEAWIEAEMRRLDPEDYA